MTIRVRLTVVLSALFALAGAVLLGVTYALTSANLPSGTAVNAIGSSTFAPDGVGGVAPTGEFNQTWIRSAQEDVLGSLLTQGAIALVVVWLAATAFGWLIAGRLLQPLQRITETARRIADAPAADRGLHERIALAGPPDEVKKLADTFDVMLERLDASFDGQRRFIADASHELRTPLTLNRALLEVALHRDSSPPETTRLCETLLDVNERHERLIEGLLLLARADAEMTDRSYVDLSDVAGHVVHQLPQGDVKVSVSSAEAPVLGDAILLERLVRNLVENAVRHNLTEDGAASVTTGTLPDGSARLTVVNTGPRVASYELPALFRPFHRRDRTRLHAPGAGLGLSIVTSIARAPGARVEATPNPAGGLTMSVVFPAVPADSWSFDENPVSVV